jgi:hypothetical protein
LVPEAKETVELGLETRMFSNIILKYLFTEQEQTVELLLSLSILSFWIYCSIFNSGTLENKKVSKLLQCQPY